MCFFCTKLIYAFVVGLFASSMHPSLTIHYYYLLLPIFQLLLSSSGCCVALWRMCNVIWMYKYIYIYIWQLLHASVALRGMFRHI